jgi:predicted secreted hydrolase
MTARALLCAIAAAVALVTGAAAPAADRDAAAPVALRNADAPYTFEFPRDHASHPDFRTEWWYYTGHLADGARRWGFELTFFRVALDPARRSSPSAWAPHTIHIVHAALTDERAGRFEYDERVARPALGRSGADTARYHVWVAGDSASLGPDALTHVLRATRPGFALALDLTPLKPAIVHGSNGVSRKSAGVGHTSHYYSLTRMKTKGTLTVRGRRHQVTGLAWMDHEFGSGVLAPSQVGWDWFSLQLDDGRELMLYRLRLADGSTEPFSSGTLVDANGSSRHLTLAELEIESRGKWSSPATKAVYPSGWNVRVPSEGLDLVVLPTVPDQELEAELTGVAYWEGSVRVTGRARGRAVTGLGYVELTGYAGRVPGL